MNIMKSSRHFECVLLCMVVLVLLSCATLVKPCGPSPAPAPLAEFNNDRPRCYNLELVRPYLEIDKYNKSYPYLDVNSFVLPYAIFGTSECGGDLHLGEYWNRVCAAKTPEEEDVAWRIFGEEINHRMYQAKSLYNVSKILFGETLSSVVLSRVEELKIDVNEELRGRIGDHDLPRRLMFDDDDYLTAKQKYHRNHCDPERLFSIFSSHCGRVVGHFGRAIEYLDAFRTMCLTMGAKEDEFADTVSQVCRDYNYKPEPIPEIDDYYDS